MATIHDVAKKAGVSTATVSRSFSKGHSLNEDTRQRVVDAADLLNYRPRRAQVRTNPLPEISDVKGSLSIGFQFLAYNEHDSILGNDFYGPVLAGAQAEADALDMHLLLHSMLRTRSSQALPPMVSQRAVAGMLIVGGADAALLRSFDQYIPHVVLVDDRDMSGKHDCLYSDGFGGAMEAVEHLINQGHRKIGFLTSPAKSFSFEDRLHGYLCALYRAGITFDPDLICTAEESNDPSEKCVSVSDISRFLRRENRPTAIFAVNDAHALALLHTCRLLSISVPTDLSIIGFDDVDFSSHTFPALSSMRVDKHQLGRLAVRRLNERLQASQNIVAMGESGIRIEVPAKLVKRDSVATAKRPPPR